MRGRKTFHMPVLAGAIICSFFYSGVQASSVLPSDLFINDPGRVLMVDGKDRNSNVAIQISLDAPNRKAFDFGFMDGDAYVAITKGKRARGGYTFTGRSIVDFALRYDGADGLFGTSDDLIYRLSDSAGYAAQYYSGPVDSSQSRNPMVTNTYFQSLSLVWDLNLDGTADVRTRIQIKGNKYDGMMPAPMAVSLPATPWLLGSGLAVLGVTLRRRKRSA